ncbi:hypothetical protein TIFTF001_048773 [Ficus carica]|uniref:Uncharacterized protein n=1 Tax=Ficus carica TaxID=3494 RepID=A0AA87YQN8_FICCA|nr:hypothetical protein TIFTF001_048767 [Ficus carica]GMN20568.1 hypothetical protein TIFTF001_048769 [Ficus carica]GMN20570.1 hypothetical protein TIFTF001_048771 [Ficus carica]GMN20582.1 hypothetical protein TIFTF001_048773 [Ficus carica]
MLSPVKMACRGRQSSVGITRSAISRVPLSRYSSPVVADLHFSLLNIAFLASSSRLSALIGFDDDATTPILTMIAALVALTRMAVAIQVWDG